MSEGSHVDECRAAPQPPESPSIGPNDPDADFICGECRAVDWASLPDLAAGGSLKKKPLAIRPLDASFAELSKSPCKVCRILSVMKPASLDGQRCTVKAFPAAQALLSTQAVFNDASQCTVLGILPRGSAPLSYRDKPFLAVLRSIDRRDFALEARRLRHDHIDYEMFTSLVRLCEETHGNCSQNGSSDHVMGLRVIEISTRSVVEGPRPLQIRRPLFMSGANQQKMAGCAMTSLALRR